MKQYSGMALNELTPDDWLTQSLLNAPPVVALIGDRIDPDDNVPVQGATPAAAYFPRLIYSGVPHGVEWAEALLIGWGTFTVKALMREDALPNGADLKAATTAIAQAVEDALTGVADPSAAGYGTMHGCAVEDFFVAPLYGVPGKRICERGRNFRLLWS